MQYLLDTHVLLLWITADKRLPTKAKELIQSHRNTIHWRVASSWEVSIKYALGKLSFDEPPEDLLPSELNRNHIETRLVRKNRLSIDAFERKATKI